MELLDEETPSARGTALERLTALSSLGHLALSSTTIEALLGNAADAIVDAIGTPFVAVVERDARGQFVMRAARGWP